MSAPKSEDPSESRQPQAWFFAKGRWAIAFALASLLLGALFIITEGSVGIWTLYLAVPLVVASFAYLVWVRLTTYAIGMRVRDELEGVEMAWCPSCGNRVESGPHCRHCGNRLP